MTYMLLTLYSDQSKYKELSSNYPNSWDTTNSNPFKLLCYIKGYTLNNHDIVLWLIDYRDMLQM